VFLRASQKKGPINKRKNYSVSSLQSLLYFACVLMHLISKSNN